MGMRIIAIDGGADKRKLCTQLGAEVFLDFAEVPDLPAEVMKITTHGAHGIITIAASRAAYAVGPSLARPGGTIVAVGLPVETDIVAGAPPLQLALKRLNIVGSVTGTLKVRLSWCDRCDCHADDNW
jgi:propanol-preferring alcohol dehydrogenase